MITRHARVLVCQSLICLISLAVLAVRADAAVIVGLLLDPPTTAGGGATSTRSGSGTWHIYGLDNSSFGISSYVISVNGDTSNNNRTPLTNVIDHNGEPQKAGFSEIRSIADWPQIAGGQQNRSISQFQIAGFGVEASNFTDKIAAIDPGASIVGPTVSGSWGIYSPPAVSPLNGRHWLFIAEGTYNLGNKPTISEASFTVYTNTTTFVSVATSRVIVFLPEPTTLALVGFGTIVGIGVIRRRRATMFIVSLLLVGVIGQSSANAAVIVNLMLDPASTAGPGVTSTRSGPNTWHVYAVDDNSGDYGISSYDVRMTNVVAVNHRSPLSTIIDHNGDPQSAGFTLLRTATNSSSIQASQSLVGTTPFLITGYGQQASDFTTKAAAIDPLSSVAGPTISATWGNYNTLAPYNGKNWVFLAEGTYNAGIRPAIYYASFTVYSNPTTFTNAGSPVVIIPEPATLSLLGVAALGMLGLIRRRRATIGFRNSFPNASRPAGVLLACLVCVAVFASSADAAVIFNVLINPPSTAGPGVTSTRSGSGSWQLYAVDDNADDFGISSYSITMANTTAINHRSPVTTVNDAYGDPQTAGFSLLRTATNRNPIQASQGLPGTTPYLIKGFGQEASSFTTKVPIIDPGAVVVGPTTSGTWGTYNNGVTPYHGKNWLFIAEGLYNMSGPLPAVTAAVVTVYNANFSSKAAAVSIPEPTAIGLAGMALVGLTTFTRRRLSRRGKIGIGSTAAPMHLVEKIMSMFAACTAWRTGSFLACFLLAAVVGGSTSQATVHIGLLLNPVSTAGGGATSTRFGSGSWQLYALDDSDTDFGISSYNIAVSGTTAINHRAPVTTINDSNTDPQWAGFNLLRTGTNVNPIQGSQGLPSSTPFLITGFGQTPGNFTTKATAIDAGAVVVGPTISGAWGNYNHPYLLPLQIQTGNNWIFLAEGLGPSGVTSITSAVVTVFSNASGASAAAPTQIVNLSSSFPTIVIDNVNANDPGMVTRDLSFMYTGPPPNQFHFLGYRSLAGVSSNATLAHPATLDPTTKEFRWNTTGAMLGEYSWHTAYGGDWNPHLDITVRITAVPEPATLSLLGIGVAGGFRLIRSTRTRDRKHDHSKSQQT